jgi:hypothetical protein
MMKISISVCTKCGKTGECRDGHRQCRDCERSYSRDYYSRKGEYFNSYREANRDKYRKQNVEILRRKRLERYSEIDLYKSKPCVDCGKTFPPYVMDFDHLQGEVKVGNVSSLVKISTWGAVLSEVSKCEVVCVCCHRLRSWTPSESVSPKRLWLRGLKGNTCSDCKGTFHYSQLDFDHVRGVKTLEVSQATGLEEDFILSEIAKCEVVCANCHRVRTYSGGTSRLNLEGDRMKWSRKRKEGVQKEFLRTPDPRPVSFRPWHQLAGTTSDKALAKEFGISAASICVYRKKVGIPTFRSARVS